jgi:hypothetical protein
VRRQSNYQKFIATLSSPPSCGSCKKITSNETDLVCSSNTSQQPTKRQRVAPEMTRFSDEYCAQGPLLKSSEPAGLGRPIIRRFDDAQSYAYASLQDTSSIRLLELARVPLLPLYRESSLSPSHLPTSPIRLCCTPWARLQKRIKS